MTHFGGNIGVDYLNLGFYSDDLGGDFESSKGLERWGPNHCGGNVGGPKYAALGEAVGGYIAGEAIHSSPVAKFRNAENRNVMGYCKVL
jgi:hypothetical protein